MSKISLSPSALGTGTLTISAPNTNTDRTLTLPDNSGTVLTSASTLGAAQLPTQLSVNESAASGSLGIDSAGRVTMPFQPGFKANKISNLQSISASVWTRVAFNSVGGTSGFNTGSAYSTSTNRFTAPVAGKYIFTASVNISAGTGGVMYVDFGINGSNNAGAEVNVTYPSGDTSIGTSVIVNLAANDTVEVDLYSTTSTTAGNRICAFSGQLLS